MIQADAPHRLLPPAPAAPLPAPTNGPLPTADTRLLRRLRRIVRPRVRLDVAALRAGAAAASDGAQAIRVTTVSPRDPHVIAWEADQPVALVVLNDGCGARIVGRGGPAGRIELPSSLCPQAFLAFCYDTETEAAGA
jgi:hypothetical protein